MNYNKEPKSETAEAYAFWLEHAVEFVEAYILKLTPEEVDKDAFGKRLEKESKQIISAVAKNDYVSIHSGKGITKSFSLACLAIWWLYTRNNARVAVTGPKFDQLKITLWAEIQKWLLQSYVFDSLKWSTESLKATEDERNAFGFILTSKEKENIQGVHANHVLWLVDEASNVDDFIFETIMSGMNDPESKIVLAGNPTKASGFFYNSFTRDKDKWKVLYFNSEDSTRAMQNKRWYDLMCRYPRDSDIFRVNVLGLPPRGNPKAIISLEECTAARDRNVTPGDYLEMGVDPASEGDDLTAIAIRRGMKLLEVRTFAKTQAPQICAYVLNMVKEYRAKTGIKSLIRVKIDDTGYGNAIRQFLSLDQTNNIEVVPCLFGGKGTEEYKDYATVMWYDMRDAINNCELVNDDDLITELSTREANYIGQNCLQVEPKREYKKRIGRSPDRADACILCYAKGPMKVFSRAGSEEATVVAFDIDWNREHTADITFHGALIIEAINLCALVLNRDLSFNGLAAIYQFFQDKLWIYKEFYQENPIPDKISRNVRYAVKSDVYTDDREPRIIGNELMFRQEGDRRPLADVLRKEGLAMSEPFHYDEFGAIALGAKMFKESKIIMHSELIAARAEINLWSIKKGTTETEKNGYCKALLLILSEVRRQTKTREPIANAKYISPYSGKSGDYRPKIETILTPEQAEKKSSWMAR